MSREMSRDVRREMSRPGNRPQAHDRGTTLIELLVSMVVVAIFLSIFSTSLISLFRTTRHNTDFSTAQQSSRMAFLVLDKQIRYADAVTAPGTAFGAQWIEWRLPTTTGGQPSCYQWRATPATGLLQYRSWVVPVSGGVATPAWVTVASKLVIGAQPVFDSTIADLVAAPFYLPSSVTNSNLTTDHPRVGVALTIGVGSPLAVASATTVFTALNAPSAPATVCSEVARS